MDHLRPKIFLHRFSGSLGHQGGGKEEVIIRPGALSSPLAGPSNPNSPTVQIDETRSAVKTTNCHILLFWFGLTIFSPSNCLFQKQQQNYKLVQKILKKSPDTCFYLFLKVWPLAPGRKMRVFKPKEPLSIFICILYIRRGGNEWWVQVGWGGSYESFHHIPHTLFTPTILHNLHPKSLNIFSFCFRILHNFLVFVYGLQPGSQVL